ncbi:uncharacterized protein LOC132263840 [Phlebotomus argentipes]|uniref:uncharacterized protein LOC132263840 n=1 Tax=Phlebotomus argentipes TaxID=94469 RepID=UPI002892B677|nr:uncharacterized protein LOC132263840 [Phlebotomus argentipes]
MRQSQSIDPRRESDLRNGVLPCTKSASLLAPRAPQCRGSDDVMIYTDDTRIENSGPSTLNATLEIYIDPPVPIKCIIAEDQMADGTGGVMTLNSGGMNHNWVFLDVQGQYGQGFHFKISIYGFAPSASRRTA